MTPLLLFLLALAAIYISTVTTAFSALMRLSLRLQVEGSGRADALGRYLEQPLRLFIPARFLLTLITVLAVTLLARVTTVSARGMPVVIASALGFVLLCEHVIPLALVRRNPERVLELLLPSFDAVARLLRPLTGALRKLAKRRPDRGPAASELIDTEIDPRASDEQRAAAESGGDEPQELHDGQTRALLRSLVEFRLTMVREVMTPRPDIVAIAASATVGQLLTLVREQQYSRIPVYNDGLDNIVGMISIKDMIFIDTSDPAGSIQPLVRPTHFVPETKLVPELLQEFQRKQVQAALVVDEYGGTSGLVTIEDLIEEIVGEIRDEYDTEVEGIVDDGAGVYVFSGRTHVRELAEHLRISVEGGGYETVGGYLLSHVGRVPAVGETFVIDGLHIEVLEAERRRINRVRVRRMLEETAVSQAS